MRTFASARLGAALVWLACRPGASAPAAAPAPAPLAASSEPFAPHVGTFPPPDAGRLAFAHLKELLALPGSLEAAPVDAVVAALAATATARPEVAYDAERGIAIVLQRSGRIAAAAEHWRRAQAAAPRPEPAAEAQLWAHLLAGASGQQSRLLPRHERWPLRLLGLRDWAPFALAWAEHAGDEAARYGTLTMVAALGTADEQAAATALCDRHAGCRRRQNDADRAEWVGLCLRLRGVPAAEAWLARSRARADAPDAPVFRRAEAALWQRQRRYDRAIDAWQQLAAVGSAAERARALSALAECLQATLRFDEAARAYRLAALHLPNEHEREQAAYAGALAHLWAGEVAQAFDALDRFRMIYGRSPRLDSARWFQGWAAYRLFDREAAAALWTPLADSSDLQLAAQAEYWLGRLWQQRGQGARAAAWYRRALGHPRSYYALLAAEHLPPLPAHETPPSSPLAIEQERLLAWTSPLGRRLETLLRLGAVEAALADLPALAPAVHQSPAAAALARAEVFAAHGDCVGASRQAEQALILSRRHPLLLAQGARAERLAYPRAFDALVSATADRERLPASLVWAVMRQESRFAAAAESSSHAMGLMQLLPKTAARIAARWQVPEPTGAALFEPARNVALGGWYLAGLLRDVRGNVPLALAAYNAGPEAVGRWLTGAGAIDVPAFVESIAKDETRRYTKAVLANLGTYARLYGFAVPPLALPLPTSIAHDIDF